MVLHSGLTCSSPKSATLAVAPSYGTLHPGALTHVSCRSRVKVRASGIPDEDERLLLAEHVLCIGDRE